MCVAAVDRGAGRRATSRTRAGPAGRPFRQDLSLADAWIAPAFMIPDPNPSNTWVSVQDHEITTPGSRPLSARTDQISYWTETRSRVIGPVTCSTTARWAGWLR